MFGLSLMTACSSTKPNLSLLQNPYDKNKKFQNQNTNTQIEKYLMKKFVGIK